MHEEAEGLPAGAGSGGPQKAPYNPRERSGKAKYRASQAMRDEDAVAARRAAANSAMVGKARTTNLEENRKALAKKKILRDFGLTEAGASTIPYDIGSKYLLPTSDRFY